MHECVLMLVLKQVLQLRTDSGHIMENIKDIKDIKETEITEAAAPDEEVIDAEELFASEDGIAAEELSGEKLSRDTLKELKPEEIMAIVEMAQAEDADEADSDEAGSKSAGKRPKRSAKGGTAEFKRMCNRVIFICLCVTMLISGGIIAMGKAAAQSPYAIMAGNTPLCYVSDKASADRVIKKLVDNYTAEGAEVKAVDTGDISAEIADDAKIGDNGIKSVDEAVKSVDEGLASDAETKVTIASTRTDIEEFTPDPVYEKDDDLFAGEAIVIEEGKDGKNKVSKIITTVNGKVDDVKVTDTETIKEGKPEKIAKGTLGLPDGADWKTYEGDPVFNDADDLIATCKKYIGAPYKYGGKSLTHGIDCVQYVRQMFAKYGISIPNKHSQIQKVGKGVSLKDAQPGDIVCWTHHVGIYIGNGKVINATRKKGVTISSVHMKKKLVTIRRVPRN